MNKRDSTTWVTSCEKCLAESAVTVPIYLITTLEDGTEIENFILACRKCFDNRHKGRKKKNERIDIEKEKLYGIYKGKP